MANSNGNGGRFWNAAIKVTIALVFIAGGALVHHETRISALESTRITTRELQKEIRLLRQELDVRLRAIEVKVGR